MVEFHEFLTKYRQTPRSRFVRKYQFNVEPIFEENSQFETSAVNSMVVPTSHVHGSSTFDIVSNKKSAMGQAS